MGRVVRIRLDLQRRRASAGDGVDDVDAGPGRSETERAAAAVTTRARAVIRLRTGLDLFALAVLRRVAARHASGNLWPTLGANASRAGVVRRVTWALRRTAGASRRPGTGHASPRVASRLA